MIAMFGPKMWALHKHDETTQARVGSVHWRRQLENAAVSNRYDGKIGPTRTAPRRIRWSQEPTTGDREHGANGNAKEQDLSPLSKEKLENERSSHNDIDDGNVESLTMKD